MLRSSSYAALTLWLLGAGVPPQTLPRGPAAASSAARIGPDAAPDRPEIQVHIGTAIVPGSNGIPNQTGSVDLGTAAVATVKPVVFTLRNSGTAALTLVEPIRLPPGFTLVRSFGTRTLAPGRSTTFVAALNSARAGKLGGPISFRTNGTAGNQFRFTATGTAFGPP